MAVLEVDGQTDVQSSLNVMPEVQQDSQSNVALRLRLSYTKTIV